MKRLTLNVMKWMWSGVFFVALTHVGPFAVAAETRKARTYAGGIDEDDLKVQADLPTPPVKVDRKSMEQRALQTFLKKGGSDRASSSTEPSKTEE